MLTLNKKWEHYVITAIVVLFMSGFMSFAMNAFFNRIDTSFGQRWFVSWSVTYTLAIPAAFLIPE